MLMHTAVFVNSHVMLMNTGAFVDMSTTTAVSVHAVKAVSSVGLTSDGGKG